MTASVVICLVLLLLILALSCFLKGMVNHVRLDRAVTLAEKTKVLHSSLLVADMHADSLLYRNSLLKRSRQGQVDLPRLVEGNVAVQVFTCVSRFPLAIDIYHNRGGADLVTALAVLQGYPRRAWGSLAERAIFQAQKLHAVQQASSGQLTILTSRADLADLLHRRTDQPGLVGAILGLEGGHCLEGRLETLDRLYAAGYRLLSPTHFFNNELGGSLHGADRQGLTPFGAQVIQRMLELHMIIDLAHASEAMMEDILALTDRPLILSHTGLRSVVNNSRNLSDEFLQRIAATGGMVGIGFWPKAVGSGGVASIARTIRRAVDAVGVEHVGLGSDFDGFVSTPLDASTMALLTEALLSEGFREDEIALVMGGNFVRLLAQLLPEF